MTCAVTAKFHERDFSGWVEQQCAALRDHDSSRLDWSGLQEELEALGRQEYRDLVCLLGHLLKWELQPDRRSRSWFSSIRDQRRAIERLLKQNPSLGAKAAEALGDGFDTGVDLVLRETDLPLRSLPAASPWTLEAGPGSGHAVRQPRRLGRVAGLRGTNLLRGSHPAHCTAWPYPSRVLSAVNRWRCSCKAWTTNRRSNGSR
jgi:hypothetical protein